jgi:outer membrane protein assembly factor BamA
VIRAHIGAWVAAVVLAAPAAALAQGETIAEVRVHGNYATPDADVIALSGLKAGDAATDARLAEARQALETSDRFDGVEVRKRFRSIDDPRDILVMIVVRERPGVTEDDLTPGAFKRLRALQQWMPILNYADGYGLTYGARTTFSGLAGRDTRLSIPLSWGGERRAAAQLERTFDSGPLSIARGSLFVNRRENPHYELSDVRVGVRLGAEKSLTPWLRAGADGRLERADFGGAGGARHSAVGAHATFDTRVDPSFPRNAVFAQVGVERVAFPSGHAGRALLDARGFVGLFGSPVLALRAHMARADAPLPPAEQPLLGGGATLRGYRAGHRAGDSLAAVSAELRVPLTSPLSFGRFGVKAFVDAGTVWSSEQRLSNQPWDRGIGGGVYFGATALMFDADVAWPERGRARAHVSFGVSF